MLIPSLALLLASDVTPPNDDAELAALIAATPAGQELRLAPGRTYIVHHSIELKRPIVILGQGATIRAADDARMSDAILRSRGVDGIVIKDLSIDANADRGGADYGIWITGGRRHHIDGVSIGDTAQACLAVEDAVATISANRLDRCGRETQVAGGSATNNHGIMIFAVAGPTRGIQVIGNLVSKAYRKGITSYVRGAGAIENLTISRNRTSDCGLGGIYIAGAEGSLPQRGITLDHNENSRDYVGMQFDNVIGLVSTDDRVNGTRTRSGAAGADGVILSHVQGGRFERTMIADAGGAGITVRQSNNVQLESVSISRPNAGSRGFGPGVHFSDVRNSAVVDAEIVDDRRTPRMTHGLVEDGTSRGNQFAITQISGFTAKSVLRPR